MRKSSFLIDFTAINAPTSGRYQWRHRRTTTSRPIKMLPALCHKYRIWNEFSFPTVFMKRVVCFISPSLWRGDIKHTTSFINTVWNENSFQILFITWQFRKISIFHEKSMYFEKIPRENRPETSCFTRRHNAPSYDVTGKEARNCSKKCYVTCVILENLWNGFMKGKIMW